MSELLTDLNKSTTANTVTDAVSEEKIVKEESSILSLLITGLIMFAIVILLRMYIAKPFIVSGMSMYPTFNSWHYLIIDEFTYNFIHEPKRGDVIVFHYPGDTSRYFIKRIIGLPGETVNLSGYSVSINGNPALVEPYIIDEKKKRTTMQTTLADDEYFVLGDNRKESADSRYWGPLKRKFIVGRPITRLFPFDKIDFIPGETVYAEKGQK